MEVKIIEIKTEDKQTWVFSFPSRFCDDELISILQNKYPNCEIKVR